MVCSSQYHSVLVFLWSTIILVTSGNILFRKMKLMQKSCHSSRIHLRPAAERSETNYTSSQKERDFYDTKKRIYSLVCVWIANFALWTHCTRGEFYFWLSSSEDIKITSLSSQSLSSDWRALLEKTLKACVKSNMTPAIQRLHFTASWTDGWRSRDYVHVHMKLLGTQAYKGLEIVYG